MEQQDTENLEEQEQELLGTAKKSEKNFSRLNQTYHRLMTELGRIEKLRLFWLNTRDTTLEALKQINPALYKDCVKEMGDEIRKTTNGNTFASPSLEQPESTAIENELTEYDIPHVVKQWNKPEGTTWPMIIKKAIIESERPISYEELRDFYRMNYISYEKYFSSITKAVSVLGKKGEVFVVLLHGKRFLAFQDHLKPESIEAEKPELKDEVSQGLLSLLHGENPGITWQ